MQPERKNCIELLLTSGANVNAADHDNATPLHIAAVVGLHDVAVLLLANGSDVTAQNGDNMTPLYCAPIRGAP